MPRPCACSTPELSGTKHGFRCPTHRAEFTQMLSAIRGVIDEWEAYIGIGDTEGHDDPVLVGARIGKLRGVLALAERGSDAGA